MDKSPSAIRLVTSRSVAVKEVSCSTVFQMAKGVLLIEVSSFQIRGVFPVCCDVHVIVQCTILYMYVLLTCARIFLRLFLNVTDVLNRGVFPVRVTYKYTSVGSYS